MSKPHVEYFRTNLTNLKKQTCQMKIDDNPRCENEIKYQYILITKSNRRLEIYYICDLHRGHFMETIKNTNRMDYIGSWDQ
jgi:hypothetical protein